MTRRAPYPHLLVFASGASMPADIAGFGAVGFHVGVVAGTLSEAGERAILALPRHVEVFLDSGAYSEVKFTDAGPVTVAPISSEEWVERLALYQRLAERLGPRLHVVAPDKVGSQAETLERLRAYRREVRDVAATGAEVLLPLQPGPMSLFDFEREAVALLGVPVTPAIPMRQKATTVATVAAWARDRRPARVHLLGLGEHSATAEGVLQTIANVSPGTVVSLDANRLAAAAGRSGGKGGAPRALTAAGDYAEREASAGRWGDDYSEMIGTPSAWLSKAELRAVAEAAQLRPDVAKRWLRAPDEPLDEEDAGYLDKALDEAWGRYQRKQEGGARRQLAVERTFGPELRRVDARTLFHALYTHAAREMMQPGSTLYNLVEVLDDKGFADEVQAVIGRALAPPRPLVLACSRTKRPGRLPAIDKYDGPLWTSLRAHRGAFPRPIYVLSAEHGLVPVSTVMDDYDRVIVLGKPSSAIEVTPAEVAAKVRRQADEAGISAVDVQGGPAYLETLRLAGVTAYKLDMDVPKGRGRGGIGDQRAALRKHLERM